MNAIEYIALEHIAKLTGAAEGNITKLGDNNFPTKQEVQRAAELLYEARKWINALLSTPTQPLKP